MTYLPTLTLACLTLLTAACGSDSECEGASADCGQPGSPDAAVVAPGVDAALPVVDAPPPSGAPVDQLDCAGLAPVATVVADNNGATPRAVSVRVGDVLRVEAGAEHSHWETSGAWSISGTSCLRFNQPGTYTSYCYFHGQEAQGTITVTP
ncbi:MAG: hypothetical protein KBG28_01875 [Kofleriaceae bacterium]|jgi:hypothetical protein|nr:hypothetical protein [Kofleriaceae bacterium]MBP6841890.1 hypothetical protein [Kofleriaceae bacterium]MBP9202703.1 hypothetical protein [Kofleriaceae bacterium]